jgi:hypothetical protein
MRVIVFLVVFFILLGMINTQSFAQYDTKNPIKQSVKAMKISSVFENNGKIPKKYTCDGANVSPPLKISNVPKNAKSLALILDDPDAPSGTFTHWVAFGISPKKTQFVEGEKKGFIEGITGLGKPGYVGPCPPSGVHRYFFKLYALDFLVDSSTKSKQELITAMQNHIIQTATLAGKYSR